MPAPRKPLIMHEISGAIGKNPQRFTDRAEPTPSGPLGTCPKHLKAPVKKIWNEISSQVMPGVLANSDRFILEIASTLMHRLRTGEATSADIGHLRASLSLMGLTPADRSRVTANNAKPDTNDPLSFLDEPASAIVN